MNLRRTNRRPAEGDMNSKRNFIPFLLLATMLLGGLAACQTEEAEQPQEAATAESPVSEVNNLAVGGFGNVSAEGEIVPLGSADLSFQIGGNVAEIMVAPGDKLSVGEPIMRLDSVALENGLRQAEAGLAAAEAAHCSPPCCAIDPRWWDARPRATAGGDR